MLSAKIASDGQWRFPVNYIIPDKIEKSILAFEDEYFYWHPGFNPISIAKAIFRILKMERLGVEVVHNKNYIYTDKHRYAEADISKLKLNVSTQ